MFVFQYGMRALVWAAWFGHKDVVEILITNGANVNCVNRVGSTRRYYIRCRGIYGSMWVV